MSNCASGTTHFRSLRSLKWVACSPSLRSAQPSALRSSRTQNHQDMTALGLKEYFFGIPWFRV